MHGPRYDRPVAYHYRCHHFLTLAHCVFPGPGSQNRHEDHRHSRRNRCLAILYYFRDFPHHHHRRSHQASLENGNLASQCRILDSATQLKGVEKSPICGIAPHSLIRCLLESFLDLFQITCHLVFNQCILFFFDSHSGYPAVTRLVNDHDRHSINRIANHRIQVKLSFGSIDSVIT
ncbi:hypothetical protein BX666DRAFT_1334163 [Dichotomocladium elegans]|nr:hypothetical protein BX666DRAFT_1334163 [Dichotomocladium elegans]